MSHQEPPLQGPNLTQRIVDSVRLTAYVRMFNLLGSLVMLLGVPGAGYLAHRYIEALDRIASKQEQTISDFKVLQGEVRHTTSDIVQGNKNMMDRVEMGERMLSDRLNAQADRLAAQQAVIQNIQTKLEDYAKYLFTKVR